MKQIEWSFPHRLLLTVVAVVLLALLWQLSYVLVLVFGGIVIATVLRGLARRYERWLNVSSRVSVLLSTLTVFAVLALTFWLVGDALADQITRLRQQLPQAWGAATGWLESRPLGRQLLDVVRGAWDGGISGSWLANAASSTLNALSAAVLMAIVGIYLAANPRLYQDGLVSLVPPSYRGRVRDALQAAGDGLSCWLLGQGIAMLFTGAFTAIGLWLLGAPLALALGLITGLLEFIPFFGPIAAGVLATLLAFLAGPQMALYVALLYFALQMIESYLLQPFVQRWAVSLPPVLTLLAALIFGILFGPMGVVFATPMMVIVMILVRKLYIEDTLQTGAAGAPSGRASA